MAVFVERGWFINSVKERTAKLSILCLLLLEIKAVNYGVRGDSVLVKTAFKKPEPTCSHPLPLTANISAPTLYGFMALVVS